jgi:NAD(P)-dependent dehydrogenase (short-subunit alcohol dehydrogenase family)
MHRVLVLGGYGFFGSRICEALARNPRIHLLIAGRDEHKATALAYKLGIGAARAKVVDAASPQLALQLRKLEVGTLVHTAGPFQEQNYAVAQAAIQARCNYLDLADARAFVGGITRLDEAARAAGVAVISGVSSLPALTSAVVDRYRDRFESLDAIRVGLTSGGRVPGIATVQAVLGYAGKRFRVLENGQWIEAHGWLDRVEYEFAKPVGLRLLGRCDVPDLDLLAQRYAGVKTVSFHAGFASDAGHKLVEWLARQVRDGRMTSALPFAKALAVFGKWMEPLLSDRGAMFIRMEGMLQGAPHRLTWQIVARENHGPHIPCAAAIALTGKIAGGMQITPGAYPCMGLLSVDDLMEPVKRFSVREFPPP